MAKEKKKYRYRCTECRQEFDVSAFKNWMGANVVRKGEDGKREWQQVMECPHCGRKTYVKQVKD